MKSLSRFGLLTLSFVSCAFADPAATQEALSSDEFLEQAVVEAENTLADDEVDEEISALEEELKRDLDELGVSEGLETASFSPEKIEKLTADKQVVFVPEETDLGEVPSSDSFELPIAEKGLPSPADSLVAQVPELALNSKQVEPPASLEVDTIAKESTPVLAVNLSKAFSGSPVIYLILLVLSVGALGIWLYSVLSLQQSVATPDSFIKTLQNKLLSNQFDEALFLCNQNSDIFSKMIACGIHCRGGDLSSLVEAMRAEGKRASIHFWQRIGLLNDIAIIAPMIGLLGTVLGMFYAFYDINRSIESITTLFDGLGVSVGTTVAGLVVAILALVLHSTAKYRLVRVLAKVENEAHTFAALLHSKTV